VNRRERAVLLLLTAALLVGAGVSYCRRAVLRRRSALSPIAVVQNPAVGCSPDPAAVAAPLDLNQASLHQLDGLPGIGPVLAGRIIDHRQRRGSFRSVSELRAVPGIGAKRYALLKDLVTVGTTGVAAESGR